MNFQLKIKANLLFNLLNNKFSILKAFMRNGRNQEHYLYYFSRLGLAISQYIMDSRAKLFLVGIFQIWIGSTNIFGCTSGFTLSFLKPFKSTFWSFCTVLLKLLKGLVAFSQEMRKIKLDIITIFKYRKGLKKKKMKEGRNRCKDQICEGQFSFTVAVA